MRKRLTLVFAKQPTPGRVKTRLTGLLSEGDAAALYRAFVFDAMSQAARIDADVWACVDHPPEEPLDRSLFRNADAIHPQIGSGLGERMAHAFEQAFRNGYERVLIVGTDLPTLPDHLFDEAFSRLDRSDRIVIGPSRDGGYYLLGLATPRPTLFLGMSFSHPLVFEATLQRAHEAGLDVVRLPPWSDVDTPEDVLQLVRDLERSAVGCTRTRRVIGELKERYPQLKVA